MDWLKLSFFFYVYSPKNQYTKFIILLVKEYLLNVNSWLNLIAWIASIDLSPAIRDSNFMKMDKNIAKQYNRVSVQTAPYIFIEDLQTVKIKFAGYKPSSTCTCS